MVHRKTPLSYKPISVGLIFLVVALLMSIVGLHKVPVEYENSGTLGPGNYTLGNNSFENGYLGYNRTLVLTSSNASIIVGEAGSPTRSMNITSNVTLNPKDRPSLEVLSGNVSYTYRARAWKYPYSLLAIPAFIFMLVGTVLVFVGYIHLNSRRR
ncbi:hypothetical protein [Thermococcus sp. Bubb.Bath]|uniref:hypothetical protein n=1 Tax=Thermococcus sp. Bubb.Bath TaxID=1638242 RepID=UPI00143C92D1|nr:hypothetical protein [Thermococcus sp. Bubb.Bath]NJF26094.1 hypothetical protein [Thermococcus sp. Bubb.Bath]